MSQPRVIQGPWVGAVAILLVMLMGTGMFYYQFYVLPTQIGPPHVPQNLTINIVAQQWAFMINGTVDSRSTPIVVHVGDNVTFHVHAIFQQDPSFAEHGFYIQGLMDSAYSAQNCAGQTTPTNVGPCGVRKGVDVTITLVPTETGEYTIICTIFCGAGHGDMHGLLDVLP